MQSAQMQAINPVTNSFIEGLASRAHPKFMATESAFQVACTVRNAKCTNANH